MVNVRLAFGSVTVLLWRGWSQHESEVETKGLRLQSWILYFAYYVGMLCYYYNVY